MPRPPDSLLYTTTESPIGVLLLIGDGSALRGLYMQEGRRPKEIDSGWERQPGAFAEVESQLGQYFAGERRSFELPLKMIGSPFQLRVWAALREIGYGETVSYGEIARRLDLPVAASRAVGTANGSNPISVIVPCHRVIGANGDLTGYGGGIGRKRILLDLEAEVSSDQLRLTDGF